MIRRLIAYDTTSRNSNLELIHWVRDYLDGLGIASTLVPSADGAKANLYATAGPDDRGGILLSGHTDVVPVDGQDWTSDPFDVVERDGRLYGRGSCDMKSFIAIALAMLPEFLRRGLETPLHLAFSYDEEVGCQGAKDLMPVIAAMDHKPRFGIVGEPTEMQVIRGHKGRFGYRCRVRGFECHSSLTDQGVNAIEYAALMIARLTEMARAKALNGPFDQGFSPPYTTIQTGLIQGGTAINIVPGECQFDFEWRNLPDDDGHAMLAELKDFAESELVPGMRRVSPEAGIEITEDSIFAGLGTPEDAEVTTLALALAERNATGVVSFGTEAGLFSEIGIPTIVCGPGSIEQAHKPDEFVALDQINQCEAFLERLMDRVCAP